MPFPASGSASVNVHERTICRKKLQNNSCVWGNATQFSVVQIHFQQTCSCVFRGREMWDFISILITFTFVFGTWELIGLWETCSAVIRVKCFMGMTCMLVIQCFDAHGSCSCMHWIAVISRAVHSAFALIPCYCRCLDSDLKSGSQCAIVRRCHIWPASVNAAESICHGGGALVYPGLAWCMVTQDRSVRVVIVTLYGARAGLETQLTEGIGHWLYCSTSTNKAT